MLDKLMGFFQSAPLPTQERRSLIRQSFKLMVEVGGVPGAIVDLSPQGLRIELSVKLKKDQVVQVLTQDRRAVQCRVVWCRAVPKSNNFHAGMIFDDSKENLGKSWVREAMQKAGFADGPIKTRRKYLRVRAGLRTTLANRAGDTLADGVALNLGMGGMLLALGVEFKPGTRVRTQVTPIGGLKPLEMESIIRSARKGRDKWLLGICFDDTNNPQVKKYLAILLKQHGKTIV